MLVRTLIHMLRRCRRTVWGLHDVGRVTIRVLPTDLDVLGHMNNGVYFSIMEWVVDWSNSIVLPLTREAAPSEWA